MRNEEPAPLGGVTSAPANGVGAQNGAHRGPAPKSDRPNIEWWQDHGGEEWLKEIERRRAFEDRYNRQEAWLIAHFANDPAARVLDFGCGYGRHLKNLKRLGHLDLFGCDMSPTQVELVGDYVGDPVWARERVRLIPALGPLPWGDLQFDVTYSSEVLIHVNPADLPAVIGELLRVTFQRLVLIENKRTSESRVSAPDHGGCWVHDLVGAFAAFGLRNVSVIEDVLADQDIYLIDLDRGSDTLLGTRLRQAIHSRDAEIRFLRADGVRRAAAIGAVQLELGLEHARAERAAMEARFELSLQQAEARRAAVAERLERFDGELRNALKQRVSADVARRGAEYRALWAEAEARRLAAELGVVENSVARRAIRKAKKLERTYKVVRGLVSRLEHLRQPRAAAPPPAPPQTHLPFAGIAAEGLPSTPEAFISAAPRVVGICHPHWRGIRASTLSLCEGVLQISEIATPAHAEAIARFLDDAAAEVVVIQGIPPGSERLAMTLREKLPKLRILNVFHGSPAQHTLVPSEAELLDGMLELARSGVLDGIGFVKVGMAESMRRIGYPAFPIYNKIGTGARVRAAEPFRGDRADIGVFVPDLWHKNLNTQVLAALCLEGSTVHVCERPKARYLDRFAERVKVHGLMPHEKFIEKMAEMDANLYVSLNECYPMTVLESLERGVICLTSHTSPIFDEDEHLFRRLVVTRADDPGAIASHLEAALADRVDLVARGHEHIRRLNEKADELWRAFVSG